METPDNNAAVFGGPAEISIKTQGKSVGERVLDRPELIDRMAQAMRLKSGLDLPHAYFVEQVKLQLSGSPAFDRSLLGQAEEPQGQPANLQSADCFKAWAIPD